MMIGIFREKIAIEIHLNMKRIIRVKKKAVTR